MNIDNSDWENRVLCSDESCIGVIGPDGRCKECGRPYDGPLPLSSPDRQEPGSAVAPDEASFRMDFETAEADDEGEEDQSVEDEWTRRKLCSDESCIGTIGPDGRCKECGRPYSS